MMNSQNRHFLNRILMAGLLLTGFAIPAVAQNNPVPLINQPLVPSAVAPGGPAFTLTVNGTGFVSGSVVNWNGSPRPTTFVSGSQLTAAIAAADIALAGTPSVTVSSPASGGGVSNVATLSVTNPSIALSFNLPTQSIAQQPVEGIAAADLNADGKLDMVVSSAASPGFVTVFLGNGDGTFKTGVQYQVPQAATTTAIADFNGDGKLDLAVVNSNLVSVLLGNGDGTFQPSVSYSAGPDATGIALGDFNNDGRLDLVIGNYYSGATVSVLLGNGDGTFMAPATYSTGGWTAGVVTGDVNRDGRLDIVAIAQTSNSVSVLLGNGDGTFQPPIEYATASTPAGLSMADLNADGKLDLAVACQDSNAISILLGNGDGTFEAHEDYPLSGRPNVVAVADLNGDGELDLAVASLQGNANSTLLGNGDGTFQSPVGLPGELQGSGVPAAAVGDFNQDGRLDLLYILGGNGTVINLQQAPALTLSPGSLTFAAARVGSADPPQTAMLTNVGYSNINFSSISITGTNVSDFTQSNTCPPSLAVGSSCMLRVGFRPTSGGTRSASVTIADNAGGAPQMIALTGTGLGVHVFPTQLNFGSQQVRTISPPQISILTNLGAQTLRITSIAVVGNEKGDFAVSNTCGMSVAPHGTCNIIVRFIPTKTGSRSATVNITDDGGRSPQKISLMGTGT